MDVDSFDQSVSALQVWQGDAATEEVAITCARRALIYPYLRSWPLTQLCLQDVASILSQGVRTVLRCLLQLHTVLAGSEYHYLLNKVRS